MRVLLLTTPAEQHNSTLNLFQFEEWVEPLERAIMIRRKQCEKENCGKTGPHPRVRGRPVDVPLPKMKPTDEKIVMDEIDLNWLENHPELNRPTRIQDWGSSHDTHESYDNRDDGKEEGDIDGEYPDSNEGGDEDEDLDDIYG